MNEFNNRILAQREILRVVNGRSQSEELFGLSSKAIDRWIASNGIESNCVLVELIKTASAKLFFLGTKSQDQVTEEYQNIAHDISALHTRIEREIERPRFSGT
jgi:hypothetical protein